MKIDIENRRPALGWGNGGLSGPALKPIAVRLVYQVAKAVRVPIIGCGGITTAEDALEFLMAGASAVQVGTATFRNPRAALDVLEGLDAWLKDHAIEDIREVICAAIPDAALTPASG
jgi:dihydroorotate dehydrogenase (NAD+) catalytic subunit